ncbi:FANCD2 opposite strand protein [Callorhinchus milii]|uniref:FANCD2 opposite strand n=1 Tax=Callorhinchus milii TaxID=7868 RepID=A0A4W3JNC2_CALMI|nr:FANCD2 opposite strand protein [Callorhinchus milii]|eukprot:gi/632946814/ref/XP_007888744.1/ PREDICTED: FANCD2 opposite strand protein [Callorhinchus milii]
MTAYQLWDPWIPFDESFHWVSYSTNSLKKLDEAERIQMPSPSDQEVALYLQDGIVAEDWDLLDLLVEPEQVVVTEDPCYTFQCEIMNETAVVLHKPQPVKLSSVDSVFGRAITTRAPKLSGIFTVSEGSAFTEIVCDRPPAPALGGLYKINIVVMIYRQLMRAVTLIYTAYQKCSYVLQHSV